jgi:hypothetical protein
MKVWGQHKTVEGMCGKMYGTLMRNIRTWNKTVNPFRTYAGPRPTVWFSSSAPMSEDVRHVFFAFVCPLSEPVRRFSSCSTDFSQQIAQVCFSMFFSFKTRIITSNPSTSLPPKTNKSWGVCGWQKNLDWKGLNITTVPTMLIDI